jgi:hypothetical protein
MTEPAQCKLVLWIRIPRRSWKWKREEVDVKAECLVARGNREADVPVVGMDAWERVCIEKNAILGIEIPLCDSNPPRWVSPLPVFPEFRSDPIASDGVRAEITKQVALEESWEYNRGTKLVRCWYSVG